MIPEYIHRAKQDLESLIAEAVGKFEAETGLYVFDIHLNQGIHGVEWSSGSGGCRTHRGRSLPRISQLPPR